MRTRTRRRHNPTRHLRDRQCQRAASKKYFTLPARSERACRKCESKSPTTGRRKWRWTRPSTKAKRLELNISILPGRCRVGGTHTCVWVACVCVCVYVWLSFETESNYFCAYDFCFRFMLIRLRCDETICSARSSQQTKPYRYYERQGGACVCACVCESPYVCDTGNPWGGGEEASTCVVRGGAVRRNAARKECV